jgi:hypothetical protein
MVNNMSKNVINIDESVSFPNGFTISDNRIEDYLQRFLSPSEYCVWRQYLRYWGGDKKYAYPSLSTIKEKTGLSEKTIRSANKSLSNKGFLKYKSGCSNRSNQYFYIPIDKLMKKYYGELIPTKESVFTPINQNENIWNEDEHNNLYEKFERNAKTFYINFKTYFYSNTGMYYVPSKKDMNEIAKIDFKKEKIFNQYNKLLETFFHTNNKYIKESDKTIYFFFRDKTQQTLIKEYSQSDNGIWNMQASNMWEEVKDIIPKLETKNEKERWLDNHFGARLLGGANKARNLYVLNKLLEMIDNNL